jgi:hypothetical protein
MLTNIFESRNKTFLNLIKLGDYLGRSLRENVEILSVEDNSVTYLTESGYVIKGRYNPGALSLGDIQIQDSKIFEDKKACSMLADKKISNLLADLLESDLPRAKNTFDGILNLWESKLKFDKVKQRLQDKAARFDESFNILRTSEFQRLVESKDQIVKLLESNKEYALSPEIRNTIKLASVISNSFDLPRLTLEQISEGSNYSIPNSVSHSLYNHLCKQELIAKELVESKANLDTVWITNEKIQKLPSYIYESNQNIMELVAEIISDIPYFAMATKKQLTSIVEGNLDLLLENQSITDKEVKNFVNKIYEFKKPVKSHFLEVLNETYGIDIQSLSDTPTFDSLIKTEIFIFEALANICKDGSNLKRVLVEFSEFLSSKAGVEAIDVADLINEIYQECGYSKTLNETTLLNYLNFERVADDLGKIGQVLKMIQAGAATGALGAAPAAMMQQSQIAPQAAEGDPMAQEDEYESDGGQLAGMEASGGDEEEEEASEDGEYNTEPDMDPEDAADEVNAEEEGGEMPEEEGEMSDEEMPEEEDGMDMQSKEELIDNMKELEELISTLKADLGAEGGEEDMEGEEEHEEPDGDEVPEINTGEGDDEVHVDVGSHNDDEEEEGEEEEDSEEEMPKKKKSKKPEME